MTFHRTPRKLRAIEYLGGKCIKCGYTKCPQALHAHHKPGVVKSFGISKALGSHMPWAKVQIELDKCELLCANCHAEEHWIDPGGAGVPG